jgi:hypothetical protein
MTVVRAAAGRVLVAMTAALALVTVPGCAATPAPAEVPVRTPAVGGLPTIPWVMAAIDPTDRRLTIQIALVGTDGRGCQSIAHTAFTQQAERIVVAVSVTNVAGPCDGAQTIQASHGLDAPLGRRPVLDGYDGGARPVLHRSDLPVPTYPPGSHQIPGAGTGVSWTVGYTRPGGPDVHLSAVPIGTYSPPPAKPENVTVQNRALTVYATRTSYRADWPVNGWEISLTADPQEATWLSRGEFQQILDGLRWA